VGPFVRVKVVSLRAFFFSYFSKSLFSSYTMLMNRSTQNTCFIHIVLSFIALSYCTDRRLAPLAWPEKMAPFRHIFPPPRSFYVSPVLLSLWNQLVWRACAVGRFPHLPLHHTQCVFLSGFWFFFLVCFPISIRSMNRPVCRDESRRWLYVILCVSILKSCCQGYRSNVLSQLFCFCL